MQIMRKDSFATAEHEEHDSWRKEVLRTDAAVRALQVLNERHGGAENQIAHVCRVLIQYFGYEIMVAFWISAFGLHVPIWFHLFH